MLNMLGDSATTIGLACLAMFVAALLRGFTGFGFGIAAVPVVAMVMAPEKAIATITLVQAAVGMLDVMNNRASADNGSLPWLIVGAVLGSRSAYTFLCCSTRR
jgi:uncharacterized membrane protein YfcA